MRFKKIFVVFVAIFWTCVQANPMQSEPECGRRNVGSGLSLGGNPLNPNAWPWIVAFAHRIVGNRFFFCGGSLVSAKHVVSAAHCYQNPRQKIIRSPRDFLAFVGKHNLKVKDEIGSAVHKVWKVILHQDWKHIDNQWDADIALIVLLTEVDLSDYRVVGTVCLPPLSKHEVTGTGSISGWGFSEEFQEQRTAFSSIPTELQLPAVSLSVCEAADEIFAIESSNRTFCAGYENQNKAACHGDSGSGFFQLKGQKYNLAGVVSMPLLDYSAYCVTDSYSIFTDVSKFTDWIKKKMDETKNMNWEEINFYCKFFGSSDVLACEHRFTGPIKSNLKMKTKYEHASSTLKASINFGTSEFIFAGIAESFSNLKELGISFGRIKFIEKEDFVGLKKLEELSLHNNKIEFLPDDVFSGLSSLTSLILSDNQIEELSEQVFWNSPNLTTLKLSNNQIKKLPEQLFLNLSSLNHLLLYANQIKELPKQLFRNLSSLTHLLLHENQIEVFPEQLFWNLPSLTRLDLSQNRIKELPERLFWYLPSLTKLNLFDNQIKKLPERLFWNLPSLTRLNLFDNQIEKLPEQLFWNLSSLILLDLSNNQIKELPEQLFWNLPNLTDLDLSKNQIKESPENLLTNLTKLRRLYFNDNLIEFFSAKLFSNKLELTDIYIYKNKITTINFDFSSLSNLRLFNESAHDFF